ncbi:LacI family transcription regulator [Streptomyces bingchenggensis BCW-1]|uniref:LacI family transcription regulator n=1 Tax=Streptomyces bingchenggensis (strain BCW-1) TaxID=749414 RepID=D7C7D7_STRBB|nr:MULTISPECIES: LacI family DNA-binding transcriptional regulator [Streptomyces]ADI10491.1 LacI family transcription regulator [Streptomyces bingchenggensis BCW-1]
MTARSADGGRKKRPTLADVARRAGVNPSTVSRALDGRHPFSRSASAERIRGIAQEIGYTPDPSAASLRRQSTRTVGVIVPRLTDTVMAMLYEEIAAACQEQGLLALVATTGDDPAAERDSGRLLLERRVDAMILTTARLDGQGEFIGTLAEQQVPYALAMRTDGRGPAAVGDDRLGGHLATRHLIDLGHTRIAVVAGPSHASSALGRTAGFREAMAEAGVDVDDDLVRPSGFSMESGEEIATQLLARTDPPTAVLCVNDNTAIGVMAAARRRGLRIPEDLSLVGYNDTPIAARLPVALTSVRVPFRDIAQGAVALVQQAIDGKPPQTLTYAPTLIPRSSATRLT